METEDFDFETHWTYQQVMLRREIIEEVEGKAHDLEEVNEDDPEAKRLRKHLDDLEDELTQFLIEVEEEEGLDGALSDAWHEHNQSMFLLKVLTTKI